MLIPGVQNWRVWVVGTRIKQVQKVAWAVRRRAALPKSCYLTCTDATPKPYLRMLAMFECVMLKCCVGAAPVRIDSIEYDEPLAVQQAREAGDQGGNPLPGAAHCGV